MADDFTGKRYLREIDLQEELLDLLARTRAGEIDLRAELKELMDREEFEISLRKELQELLT